MFNLTSTIDRAISARDKDTFRSSMARFACLCVKSVRTKHSLAYRGNFFACVCLVIWEIYLEAKDKRTSKMRRSPAPSSQSVWRNLARYIHVISTGSLLKRRRGLGDVEFPPNRLSPYCDASLQLVPKGRNVLGPLHVRHPSGLVNNNVGTPSQNS